MQRIKKKRVRQRWIKTRRAAKIRPFHGLALNQIHVSLSTVWPAMWVRTTRHIFSASSCLSRALVCEVRRWCALRQSQAHSSLVSPRDRHHCSAGRPDIYWKPACRLLQQQSFLISGLTPLPIPMAQSIFHWNKKQALDRGAWCECRREFGVTVSIFSWSLYAQYFTRLKCLVWHSY